MYLQQIELIKQAVAGKWDEIRRRRPHHLQVEHKADGSPVTELDTFICRLVGETFAHAHPELHFLSEEKAAPLRFPALILDPVDGTRELVVGLPEWAISLAVMHSPELSHPQNFAWIYAPSNGFELAGTGPTPCNPAPTGDSLKGLVSRREWPSLKSCATAGIELRPCGSIAYKLGLLAANECDFVYSARPKNIWDIAAGCLLTHWRGFGFWQGARPLENLEQLTWPGPFLWAKAEHLEHLAQLTHKDF